MNKLRRDIEELRENLCLLIENKELIDNEVVMCSQELDDLLVQYQKKLNLKCINKSKVV